MRAQPTLQDHARRSIHRLRVHRRLLLAVGLAALVVGCGGGGDEARASDASGEPAASQPEASAPGSTDGTTAAGENVAVVTIGELRYEIDVTPGAVQRCDPDFFGAFQVIGGPGESVGIDAVLAPEGDANFEPPYVDVRDDENGHDWEANIATELTGMGVPEGASQVTSMTIEGTTVSGEATFVDANAVFEWVGQGSDPGSIPEGVPGTFSITCAG